MSAYYNGIATLLAHPKVAAWLIARAQRTPYSHLVDYMGRWWLFNLDEFQVAR